MAAGQGLGHITDAGNKKTSLAQTMRVKFSRQKVQTYIICPPIVDFPASENRTVINFNP